MKVHYKSVICEHMGSHDPSYKAFLEDKTEFCCGDMKAAIQSKAVDTCGTVFTILEEDQYEPGTTTFPIPISFCPFCGAKIEWVKDLTVRRELHTVNIRKKVIPARTERKYREVPVK